MNTPLKVAIVVGALSSTGGGAYLIHQQISTGSSILKKLEKEGYRKLDKESEEWTIILTNYKEAIANGKNPELKFENLEGTEDKEKIQQKCELAFNKSGSDKGAYKKAKKWCTVPRKLSEILKKEGYIALNSDTAKDEDQSDWNAQLGSYDSSNVTAEKKFNGLVLKTGASLQKDQATRNKLKGECKKLDDIKHYDKDFETNLEKAKLWCAKA